jgi:2-alkyl-3-oxoalkanoate reductase
MQQRVLVLGATGFIGQKVVEALAKTDWAIPVSASRTAKSRDGIETRRVDGTNPDQLSAAIRDVSAIVNCIAGGVEAITDSGRILFDVAASQLNPPRIVHMSSMAVYGDAVGEISETTAPEGELSPYGAAKARVEEFANSYRGQAIVFRPGIVYGPDSTQWSKRIGQWLTAHRVGDLGKAGDGLCNLVYVDDVVQAVLLALNTDIAGGTFNLAIAEPPSWNDYFMQYGKALGAVPLSRITSRRLKIETKVLAPPLKIMEIALGKISSAMRARIPEPMPPSLLRLFGQEIRLKSNAVESALGLTWTPLERGLRETAAWFLTQSSSGDRT